MAIDYVLGIDVGATGAIAYMQMDPVKIILTGIVDMPIDKEVDGKFLRSRVNAYKFAEILKAFPSGTPLFVERPEGRPIFSKAKATGMRMQIQPSAKNMLSFGEQFGVIRGAAAALGMAIYLPKPGEWKKAASIPGNKDEARALATQRFPAFAGMFVNKNSDGRAEAALLALYGRQQILQTRR